jgi:PhoH-like ATPase
MPLPKLPTKPATLLSPSDYPKAEKGKTVKPSIKLLEPAATPVQPEPAPVTRAKLPEPAAAKSRPKVLKAVETRAKSSTSRAADKAGSTKLFVLETNVQLHDPTSLFRY